MPRKAEAQMTDISMTDARKERGYRECISRCCREKNIVVKVNVEDTRGYWSIGVRGM